MAAHSNDPQPLTGVSPQNQALVRFLLKQHIETKVILNDACATIPPEGYEHVQEEMTKEFEESYVKRLMQQAKVQTRAELDRNLRSLGSSLDREKQWFMEQALAQQWKQQQTKCDEEITHFELLEWYQKHGTISTSRPAHAGRS